MTAPGGAAPAWLALAAAMVLGPWPAGRPARLRLRVLAAAGRARAAPEARDRRLAPAEVVPRVAAGLAGLAIALVAGVAGPALALAATIAALTAGLVLRDVVVRRAVLGRRRQLLAALRLLVGELAAGARPGAALSAAAVVGGSRYGPVLAGAAAALGTGSDAAGVLMADADTRALGLAWRLGADTGAGLQAVLARVADDLAAADEQARTVAVALAGPRSSAAVLAGLPLLGIGLGVAMGARPLAFLSGSAGGRAVGAVGVLLDAAGVLWMRRIVRCAERP